MAKNGWIVSLYLLLFINGLNAAEVKVHESKLAKRLKYESMRSHHMERHISRDTFVRRARASEDAMHEVVIAVRQQNLDALKEEVLARSTPGNPLYQRWLSFEEVGNMVQNEEAYGAVMEWLEAYDVEATWSSPYYEYIRASARIGEWERMLSTEFYEFQDLSHNVAESGLVESELGLGEKGKTKGIKFYRGLEYSIPEVLKESINAIFHTVQTPPEFRAQYMKRISRQKSEAIYPFEDTPFKTHLRVESLEIPSQRRDKRSQKITTTQVGADVTISFLNKLYKVNSNLASPRLNQSVFQTGNQYYSTVDLLSFQKKYKLTQQPAISIANRDVTYCPQTADAGCDEGNLDIQYIMGMAQRTASIFWYVSHDNGDPFVQWIQAVVAEKYPPQSNSISWGSVETLVSPSTVNAWETEAMKLAGRGVTIAVSSGDDGAPNSSSGGTCYCANVRPVAKGYNPYYPATSQWVTTIGATMGPETGDPEVACDSKQGGVITSGGGFSTIVKRPAYQNSTLVTYFKRVASNPPVAGFKVNGRAYPDLSFIGVNYQVIINGDFYSVYGTSASAPLFASFVSLLNSARLAANKTAIGFLNPTLYSVGYNITKGLKNRYNATFNDVTSGNNKCCKGDSASVVCCNTGFTAVEGWDPVTGWGSINYPDFANIFQIAAPYTPPKEKKEEATIAGIPLWIVAIIVVVVIILVIVMLILYCCCQRGSVAPRAKAIHPTTSVAQHPPVEAEPINFQPHRPQPKAQQKYAPSF